MRTAATVLLILALAALSAADEDRVRFEGEFETDHEDLRKVAARDIERCLRFLDESREAGADESRALRRAGIAAEDAVFEMVRRLRREGYPNAKVTTEVGADRIAFVVREGTRTFLGEVTVEGAVGSDPEELAGLLRLPKTGFLGSTLFLRAEAEATTKKLVNWLRQHGYLRAEAEGPFFTPAPLEITGEEAEVNVRYVVREGPRARLRSVDIRGMVRFREDQIEDEFGGTIRDLVGEPFGPLTVYDIQSTLIGFYSSRGHPYAMVTWDEPMITESADGLDAAVMVRVEEGPRVRVGNIRIEGNVRTEEEAVRRELSILTGEAYDSREIAQSRRHLLATRLFGNVRIEIPALEELDPGDPVVAEHTLHVEEVDHRRLDASVGFGSWDLLRGGVSMTWMNLGGMARRITTELDVSLRGARLAARASDPWLFPDLLWDRTVGTLELSAEVQERPTYSYTRATARLKLTKRQIAHRLDLSFGYLYRFTDVTDVDGDLDEDFVDTTNTGALFLELVRDARDDPWNPTRGSILSANLEFANGALGSDLDFLRGRLRAVQIIPLGERSGLVICAEAGAVAPYGATDGIPIQERFFLGGGQTVRSFAQDDLGPREDDHAGEETDSASGGEFFSRLSLEVRFPIVGDLEGAVFLDVGNVVRELGDGLFRDYRFGPGVGLRVRTPIGAARVDFAINPSPRDFEDSFGIFFALGYPF